MQKEHCKPHQETVYNGYSSEEEFAEEIRAETRKYNALRNEVGRAFQPLQEAAYETYCEWEAEMAAEAE